MIPQPTLARALSFYFGVKYLSRPLPEPWVEKHYIWYAHGREPCLSLKLNYCGPKYFLHDHTCDLARFLKKMKGINSKWARSWPQFIWARSFMLEQANVHVSPQPTISFEYAKQACMIHQPTSPEHFFLFWTKQFCMGPQSNLPRALNLDYGANTILYEPIANLHPSLNL